MFNKWFWLAVSVETTGTVVAVVAVLELQGRPDWLLAVGIGGVLLSALASVLYLVRGIKGI